MSEPAHTVPAGDESGERRGEEGKGEGYSRSLLPGVCARLSLRDPFLRGERGVGGPAFIPEPIRAPVLVVFILTRMHAYVYMHLKYSTVGP